MKKSRIFYFIPAIALMSLLACNDAKKQVADSATNEAAGSTAVATAAKPASGEKTVSAEDAPAMTFTEKEFDFGTIKEGDVVTHVFKFTNTGKTPLVIQNASAPCGCTVPDWPHEPVAPGATGEINVKFNSKGKSGLQNKPVTIVANTQPDVSTVTLKGNVEPGISSMNGPVQK
jgi:hypothetical protein